MEGFFGHLKPSIKGTYRRVSHHWLQGYLNEFTWRRNARLADEPILTIRSKSPRVGTGILWPAGVVCFGSSGCGIATRSG